MRNWNKLVGRAHRMVNTVFGQTVQFQATADLGFGQTAPDPVDVEGVFDPNHVEVDAGGTVPVHTIQPVFDVMGEHLPREPYQGDSVTVAGTTYTVSEVRPDAAGNYRLMLREGQLERF